MSMKFHYSSYWGNWSRVLLKEGWYVELDLTPIGGLGGLENPRQLEDIKREKIRVHGTSRQHKDIDTEHLPEEVTAKMIESLGATLTHRLLHHNYMNEITLDEIRNANSASNGGGVPFSFIIEHRQDPTKRWVNK